MNTLKRKLTAILLTFAMLFSLMPALPQAAEAADQSKPGQYVTLNYETGTRDYNIDVQVYLNNEYQETISVTDARATDDNISIVVNDSSQYVIGMVVSDNVVALPEMKSDLSAWSCRATETNLNIKVYLAEKNGPGTPNGVETGSHTYKLQDVQIEKILYLATDIQLEDINVTGIDVNYREKHGGLSEQIMNPDSAGGQWYCDLLYSPGDAVHFGTGSPYNIESLTIKYNGTETTIPYEALRFVLQDNGDYMVESRNDSVHALYFYNQEDGFTHYTLYAKRFVNDGETLGDVNMPKNPTYGNGNAYRFVNWSIGDTERAFYSNTPVYNDMNLYAKKVSSSEAGGIYIHVVNENDAFLNRLVELYNAEHETDITINDIDKGSMKMQANDGDGTTSTNPDYFSNGWDQNDPFFLINNPSASGAVGDDQNDHVGFDTIASVTVYFYVTNDGQKTLTIPVGQNAGELSKVLLDGQSVLELSVIEPPTPPTAGQLENQDGILGAQVVTVDCTTKDEHADTTYGLLPESYDVSEKAYWANINGEKAYYVDVTVENDSYVGIYNETHPGHTITGAETQTITLKWTDSAWTAVTDIPVTFNVKCESEEPTEPETPSDEIVKELLENAVTVECNNESATHDNRDGKTYGLIEDGYTLAEKVTGDADDGYTYTVTIQPDAYVSQYSTDTEVDHDLDPADQENKTITLEWTGTEWQVAEDSTPVTITVHCDSEEPTPTTPEKPDADDLNDLFDVELDCGSNVGHQNKIYKNLLSDSYTLDDQVTTNTDGTYTIGVTVKSAEYIKDYDKQDLNPAGKHEIKEGEESSKTVTLMYNEDEEAWTVDESDKLITFLIVCSGTGNYDINGITKDLVAGETDKNTAAANGVKSFDGLTIPEENEKVIIPAGESVTLLYSITVTGNANKEVEFVVKDKDTTLVKSNADVTQKDDGTYTGTIPAGGNVTFYVSKEFTGANINKDGELVNTASVDGADDETTVDPDDKVDETVPAEDGPALPDQDAMNALLDVVLDCASNVGHADGTYKDLLENSYDFGDVTHNDEGAYSVGVTIDSDKYIADYSNNVVKVAHEIQDETQATKTVTLTYDKDHETWTTTGSPVEFLIVCEGVDWDISNIEKDLVTEATLDDAKANGVSDDALKNIIVPEDMDDTVIIPEDGSVTLLYAITVSGKAGIAFSVEDPGTTLVKSSANVSVDENADVATYTGSIPENGIVTFYVSKNFTVDNITENGQLVNSATVAGDDGTTVNPGTEDDPANKDDEAIAGEEEDNRPTPPPYIPGGDDDDNLGDNDGPSGLNTEDHFSYVVGYEDGMVKPQRSITRAEVATIFYRLLEDDVRDDYDTTRNNFSDVTSDSWYNQTVSTLASMGILKGYEDGTFRPNASITRAEFAAIATRFFEETGATYEPGTFTDVTGDEWFAGAIMDAVNLGLIGGYEDGTVRPNNNITRAEACAIVNRTLGRVPDADHLLPADEMTTWPDNPSSAWFYADMQEATNGHEYEWITEDGNKIEEWTDILDKDWNDR